MRHYLLLATTFLLGACGGGGPETIVSAPPPAQGGADGGGSTNTTHTFANPTEPKTYDGVGATHTYEYLTDARDCCDQQGVTYSGNASTVRNSNISIAYDPREAVYTLQIQDPLSGANVQTRYQDPANRTDFGGTKEPQWGTPNLSNPNIRYLQAGDGNPRSTYSHSGTGLINPGTNEIPPSGIAGSSYQATSLFVLQPGSETQYVSFAGYARNALTFEPLAITSGDEPETVDSVDWHLERGAFAFGQQTANDSVPKTGSGSYAGSMIGSMIFNPTIDGQDISGLSNLPSYFQWIEGSANISVDFANSVFNLALDGTVLAPQIDRFTGPTTSLIVAGADFAASGKGDINLVQFGGFKGAFQDARFTNPDGSTRTVAIEGSSIDGAFYGPNAQEVGGGFRIVGGNPDERVDILGAFVGRK